MKTFETFCAICQAGAISTPAVGLDECGEPACTQHAEPLDAARRVRERCWPGLSEPAGVEGC